MYVCSIRFTQRLREFLNFSHQVIKLQFYECFVVYSVPTKEKYITKKQT